MDCFANFSSSVGSVSEEIYSLQAFYFSYTFGVPLTVFISVRTNQHNQQWAENFKSVVEDIPGVLEVYRMGGEIDYLIKAAVEDMPGYDRLYQKLIKADLFDVSASFVMEELKQTTELPIPLR